MADTDELIEQGKLLPPAERRRLVTVLQRTLGDGDVTQGRTLADFLRRLASRPRRIQTRDQIDRDIQAERGSWG